MLGPITLSDYDADRRWKLRDKCLRVATFYRMMHMPTCVSARGRTRRVACVRCVGFSQGGRRAFSHTHSTWRCRLHMGLGQQWTALVGRGTLVYPHARMRMTAPDLYREARRNAPRRRAVLSARRRVRLPSMVDTEIGARLYGDMCNHRLLGAAWACSRRWLRPPSAFLFPTPGFGRLP